MAPKKSNVPAPALARGRRGRPTSDAVVAIDAAIVAAAWRMFLDEGYGATSMDAVAKRAGISKGTLYARFDSKPRLFAAVITHRVAVWSAEASQQDSKMGSTLEERLTHHATIFLNKVTSPEAAGLSRLVLAESVRFPELGRIAYEQAFSIGLDVIAKELESTSLPSQHRLTPTAARAVASALVEGLFGWANLQAMLNLQPSAATRRRVARQRVGLLLQGQAAWSNIERGAGT